MHVCDNLVLLVPVNAVGVYKISVSFVHYCFPQDAATTLQWPLSLGRSDDMSAEFLSLTAASSIIFTLSGFHPSLTDPVSHNNLIYILACITSLLLCCQTFNFVRLVVICMGDQRCWQCHHYQAEKSLQHKLHCAPTNVNTKNS